MIINLFPILATNSGHIQTDKKKSAGLCTIQIILMLQLKKTAKVTKIYDGIQTPSGVLFAAIVLALKQRISIGAN